MKFADTNQAESSSFTANEWLLMSVLGLTLSWEIIIYIWLQEIKFLLMHTFCAEKLISYNVYNIFMYLTHFNFQPIKYKIDW